MMSEHIPWSKVREMMRGSGGRQQSAPAPTPAPPFESQITEVGELLTLGEMWIGDLTRSHDDPRRGNLLCRQGRWRIGVTPSKRIVYGIHCPFAPLFECHQWRYRQTIPVERYCGFADSIGSLIVSADIGAGVGRLSYIPDASGEAICIRVEFRN